MPLRTRLTEKLGIRHPVLPVPMGNIPVADSSVRGRWSRHRGRQYGDMAWLERQIAWIGIPQRLMEL
jgi:hypothetical protein